jgi:hypothetical protein
MLLATSCEGGLRESPRTLEAARNILQRFSRSLLLSFLLGCFFFVFSLSVFHLFMEETASRYGG